MVLDASAAVELLRNTTPGRRIAARLREERVDLHVPHLIDVEIAQAIRRYVRLGNISEERALIALGHWRDLDIDRHDHEPFLDRIWQLRDNLTAYDAAYVALAEILSVTLLTADGKLARVPGSNANIELI